MLLNSKLLQSCLLITSLSIATTSSAALFTQGDLTYDDATSIISGNGKEYLGFGVGVSWDYATTLANTSTGGLYESFTIADTSDADGFIDALFGSNVDNCSTVDHVPTTTYCGQLGGWFDGKFGDTYVSTMDYFYFVANESNGNAIGVSTLRFDGHVNQFEDLISFVTPQPFLVPWLLVRDIPSAAAVPEPSIIAIMALGLFGLGLARRKIRI